MPAYYIESTGLKFFGENPLGSYGSWDRGSPAARQGQFLNGQKTRHLAAAGARMRIQAMREGAVEFLAKPLDYQLLLKTVRAALDL